MIQQLLYSLHASVTVLAAAAALLLAYLFYSSAKSNHDAFTSHFLRLLTLASVVQAVEILSATYRTSRIDPVHISIDASAVALFGRLLELAISISIVLFLLRPETKRALNGGGAELKAKAGELSADFWTQRQYDNSVRALRDTVRPEFLK